jgi:hypothetical protein
MHHCNYSDASHLELALVPRLHSWKVWLELGMEQQSLLNMERDCNQRYSVIIIVHVS